MLIMSDSLLLLQNLKWSDSFEDLPLDLCLYPQVFNMFVAAVNERLVVAARWIEHLQYEPMPSPVFGGSSIQGYFKRFYGSLSGGGTFEYAVEPTKIYNQPHKILPINEVSNKSVMALGVPDAKFYGHLNAEDILKILDKIDFPIPKDFNIKTQKFDITSNAGVNNWVWLQGVVGFLAFFFAKQDDIGTAESLGDQQHIASWRSVYDAYTKLADLENKIKPHSFNLAPGMPLPQGYSRENNYLPRLFRRVYPRTISRLDEAGFQGSVARLIAGDTTHEIKNPNYDPGVIGSQEYIKVPDPEYAEIKHNYQQLYIYDIDGYLAKGIVKLDARGIEIFPAWRLLTEDERKTVVNPDMIVDAGWIEKGDYFGPWILEDLREALNSFKFVQINKTADVVLNYTTPGLGINDKTVTLTAPAAKGDTFLNGISTEIKVGRYALTGNPNKIISVGDTWFAVQNPIELPLTRVTVSDDSRIFLYQNAQPEIHFDPVPIIYSGNLPTGTGVYYPGFGISDINLTASYTPQKYGWFSTQVAHYDPGSGTSVTWTLICSQQSDMAAKIKTVHYFGEEYLGNQKPDATLDFVRAAAINQWPVGYDPVILNAQTYDADKLYCFIAGYQSSTETVSSGFPNWRFAIVEFDFEYKGE